MALLGGGNSSRGLLRRERLSGKIRAWVSPVGRDISAKPWPTRVCGFGRPPRFREPFSSCTNNNNEEHPFRKEKCRNLLPEIIAGPEWRRGRFPSLPALTWIASYSCEEIVPKAQASSPGNNAKRGVRREAADSLAWHQRRR